MFQNFVALLEVLVCPVCHQKLEQAGEDAAQTSAPTDGWLHCIGCGRYYPIEDGLAVMIEERASLKPSKDAG